MYLTINKSNLDVILWHKEQVLAYQVYLSETFCCSTVLIQQGQLQQIIPFTDGSVTTVFLPRRYCESRTLPLLQSPDTKADE